MYYDNKNQILTNKLPKNSIGPDGTWYINFDQANNIELWASHNYYTVRNDNDPPSDEYIENIDKRTVILDYPYADIIRVWELSPGFVKDEII